MRVERSAHQEHGAAGPMHDPMRHATQHETIKPLSPVGADHDEVVALSHFTHSRRRITRANMVDTVKCGLANAWAVSFTTCSASRSLCSDQPSSPTINWSLTMWSEGTTERMVTAMGFLKGCDCQPRVKTGRVLPAFHRHEDAAMTGRAFPFTIKVGTVAWSRTRCETLPVNTSAIRL